MYSSSLGWHSHRRVSKNLRRATLLLAATLLLGASQQRALAEDKEERVPTQASFNSDATLIVYVDKVKPAGEVLPTTTEIWTVFPDGKGRLQLTKGHKDSNPRFSPDGKHIIFERDNDGEIWMMNANGADAHNATKTPDVREQGAHFSNDGTSLFLLAPAPNHITAAQLAAEPMLALGMGANKVVVQLNLKDGTRRQLLGEEYNASTVFPDPDDDKNVFVLCNPLKANGTPELLGDKVIASVSLNGGAPHAFYVPPTGYDVQMARSNGKYFILSASTPEDFGDQGFWLNKADVATATEDDLKKLEKITFLGDLSPNGMIIGTALTTGIAHWGLVVYDIASDKWRTVMED